MAVLFDAMVMMRLRLYLNASADNGARTKRLLCVLWYGGTREQINPISTHDFTQFRVGKPTLGEGCCDAGEISIISKPAETLGPACVG